MDTDLDVQGVTRVVHTITVAAPSVEATVEADAGRSIEQRTTHVGKADGWTWQDLQAYVVQEIEARFGLFPRNACKESGIFKSFLARWGEQAPAIARFAFDSCDGYWRGAPISVNRFCKASDDYFASVIVASLAERRQA